jgi:hypothetical protein
LTLTRDPFHLRYGPAGSKFGHCFGYAVQAAQVFRELGDVGVDAAKREERQSVVRAACPEPDGADDRASVALAVVHRFDAQRGGVHGRGPEQVPDDGGHATEEIEGTVAETLNTGVIFTVENRVSLSDRGYPRVL